MTPPPPAAPRLTRQERRARLLEAAIDAIRRHGPGVSMEQLAGAGGVTKPILYRHFGDRDGLVTAIGETYAETLLARLSQPLHGPTDPATVLRATVDGYLAFLEDDPELYTFLMRQDGSGASGRINGLVEVVGREVAVVIGDQLRALGADAGGAEPWAFGIVGMVHQAGDWWIRTRTMSRTALADYLSALLLQGFEGVTGATAASRPAVH